MKVNVYYPKMIYHSLCAANNLFDNWVGSVVKNILKLFSLEHIKTKKLSVKNSISMSGGLRTLKRIDRYV